jgi:hypothetical protein
MQYKCTQKWQPTFPHMPNPQQFMSHLINQTSDLIRNGRHFDSFDIKLRIERTQLWLVTQIFGVFRQIFCYLFSGDLLNLPDIVRGM